MRHVLRLLPVALVLLLPCSAQAQASDRSWELQLQGSLTLDKSDNGNNGLVILRPGWFLTDRHQVGLTISGRLNGDELSGDIGPFYTYNLPEREQAPFTPYLLSGITTSVGDSGSDRGEAISLGGGMRFPLTPQGDAFSISVETMYSLEQNEFSDQLRIQFGFSHFLDR